MRGNDKLGSVVFFVKVRDNAITSLLVLLLRATSPLASSNVMAKAKKKMPTVVTLEEQ